MPKTSGAGLLIQSNRAKIMNKRAALAFCAAATLAVHAQTIGTATNVVTLPRSFGVDSTLAVPAQATEAVTNLVTVRHAITLASFLHMGMTEPDVVDFLQRHKIREWTWTTNGTVTPGVFRRRDLYQWTTYCALADGCSLELHYRAAAAPSKAGGGLIKFATGLLKGADIGSNNVIIATIKLQERPEHPTPRH
jgi:hypothetical protein